MYLYKSIGDMGATEMPFNWDVKVEFVPFSFQDSNNTDVAMLDVVSQVSDTIFLKSFFLFVLQIR